MVELGFPEGPGRGGTGDRAEGAVGVGTEVEVEVCDLVAELDQFPGAGESRVHAAGVGYPNGAHRSVGKKERSWQ